jgi:perosamine synthetase
MDASHRQTCDELISALHEVLGQPVSPLPLHEPEFAGNEWAYVKECIDTGWVSSVGKFVDGFERQLVEVTGARHAVAVVNGTAALHMALLLAGVKPGDEVLVPAMSFVGTANSVAHAGAIPHFVDGESRTLGIDPQALRVHLDHVAEKSAGGLRNRLTGRRIAAIVPMHAFGHAADLDGLLDVASAFGLPVVEDAAESLGSTYKGRHTGTFGLLGILSFNGNKVITTGGGGAILTNDEALARRAKHLTTTAKKPHRWAFVHEEVAYNYRMPNINAALGCAQLERLPDFLSRKRQLAQRYREVFARLPAFEFVEQPVGCESNFWLVAVRLRQPNAELRDVLLAAVNDAGFHCRPVWTLLNKLPMYLDCPRAALPVAQGIEDSLINLPSSPKLVQRTP